LVGLILVVVAVFYIINSNKPVKIMQATIETDKGNIELELNREAAPNTVDNFVKLSKQGFYDGTTFHRVVPNFVIQGGDPLSKDPNAKNVGSGGPGYTFKDEINPKALGLSDDVIQQLEDKGYTFNFLLKSIPHKVGTISMANSGPNTNGSQFFIVTTQDQPNLDGMYTAFGQVVSGMDVVQKIQQGDIIKKITIK
jgi:peptidyl-prolyl cis-trans isomerase B (cyclophilin B)